MDSQLALLGDVLQRIEEFHWQDFLFAETRPPWTAETRCAVLERDPYSDELPDEAKRLSLVPVLDIQVVQSVVRNAMLQRPDLQAADLVRALEFYFKRDAFIEF
ncbi:hypothetical protein F0U60_53865 [Archangium minus]|uniref:DUF7716 domain-containing protein n=1 Tax=Archangium minus TaxID=83450 RepID=A0ABY9X9E0_9BACT|nr:hypothetical protein F0U60_53865 [Archangium minus]